MHVTFVIISYESSAVLADCLRHAASIPDSSVVVVDNGSKDDSISLARSAGAHVIAMGRNAGFAAAANAGAAVARENLLCFLNPDCVVTAGAVEAARVRLKQNPRACAVPNFHQGGGTIPGKQPGYTWRKILADLLETNHRQPRWLARLQAHPRYHDPSWSWPLGTCLFIPAGLFREVGGFDERYFLYMEDVELGRRLSRAGVEILQLPVQLVHGSMKSSAVDFSTKLGMLNRARMNFARRHYGWVIGAVASWLAAQSSEDAS